MHKSILRESDNRSTIQKLQDLIAHKNTEETIRQVAIDRLKSITGKDYPQIKEPEIKYTSKLEPLDPFKFTTRKSDVIYTNLRSSDWDRMYTSMMTTKQVYDSLCRLTPPPNEILFYSQGEISISVPPPYMGMSKRDYYSLICRSIPGVKGIVSTFIDGKGYNIKISFISTMGKKSFDI